jgi:hypothetical protein
MAKKNNDDMMSGWVGWIAYASVMLYLIGFMHLIAGFAALFTDTVYLIGESNIWALDYTQWGWIHVIGGALAILAAGSLMAGKGYGRTVAVLVAFLSILANMLFIPIYPIWSLIMITVGVLVIYGVVAHGSELKDR